MAPAQGVQVFYDNNPPEAIAVEYPGNTSDEPGKAATRKPRLRLVGLLLLVVISSIAIALGVGIGVGLERRGRKNDRETAAPSSTSAMASQSRYKFGDLIQAKCLYRLKHCDNFHNCFSLSSISNLSNQY